jgi:hypothetical protein
VHLRGWSAQNPHKDDIDQGLAFDCYFLATLGAVAKTNPDKIRQSVVDLGDGTYAVQYSNGGSPVFYRVDADLPTDSFGQLVHQGMGQEGSLWAALMEKAYAHHRTGANAYVSLYWGFASEVFADLGVSSTDFNAPANSTALLQHMANEMAANKAVTYLTGQTAAPGSILSTKHMYMVEAVNFGWSWNGLAWSWQPISVTLRNPLKTDGEFAQGANDGWITVGGQEAMDALWTVTSAVI